MARLATPEGTAQYARAHPDAAPEHWRHALGLTLSTLGFGSYLGDESPEADADYAEAFKLGLQGGVNVLDTAANYRGQRSERNVGAAIRAAEVPRERFLLATKGGFVPYDRDSGLTPSESFRSRYLDTGIVDPDDLVAGCHVMTPRYLEHELAQSLRNLGVESVDVYFLHNPETQLEAGIRPAEFDARLLAAFRALEAKRRTGQLGVYGLATWNGLRRAPGQPGHLGLERILRLAREAGGDDHGLRALELPYNLGMTEAARLPTQPWNGRTVPLLEAARDAGVLVLGSATLLQGRLLRSMPPDAMHRLGARTPAEAAIQFSRSTLGITSALVGTGRPRHARDNLAAARLAPRPEAAQAILAPG